MEEKEKKAPFADVNPVLFVCIVLFVVFIAYQVIGALITFLVTGGDIKVDSSNVVLMRILISFSQFMFILFPAILLSMLQGNKSSSVFRLKNPPLNILLLSILGILLIQPSLQVIIHLQDKLFLAIPGVSDLYTQLKEIFKQLEEFTISIINASSVFEFIGVVFVIAVTPAICEEFLFRGLILKNFERVLSWIKACVFTGVLFAIFHFQPINIIPLILLGIFLSVITVASDSIYPAIICHFLNNFIAALAFYIYGKEDFTKEFSGSDELYFIILGIVSLILFFAIMIYIIKFKNKQIQNIV
ncbi:MAG TPA: CPBP family intramembrane metalloprotease [Ignavibacteria bacterium]|nr:CPBP family intramembrane metalloprotease [Ignavibacteria bacterium]